MVNDGAAGLLGMRLTFYWSLREVKCSVKIINVWMKGFFLYKLKCFISGEVKYKSLFKRHWTILTPQNKSEPTIFSATPWNTQKCQSPRSCQNHRQTRLCGSLLDFKFIRECMKIYKTRPKFHFLTKIEINMTHFVFLFSYLLFFFCF